MKKPSLQHNQEHFLIEQAEIALRNGAPLFSWWKAKESSGSLRKFPLFPGNPYPEILGFYDALELDGRTTSVMGCLQRTRFPRKQASSSETADAFATLIKSSFLQLCKWSRPEGLPGGFGYTALHYKLKDSGDYGVFPRSSPPTWVDLAEVGSRYDWILLQVDIYDFVRGLPGFHKYAKTLSRFFKEAAYVALSSDYSYSVTALPEGAVAECCFGYSFLPCLVEPNFFGFGPGRFGAAIKQFRFILLNSGQLEIQLAFIVAPRSQKVLYLWGFDPVYSSIHLLNALTFNLFGLKQRAHDRLDALMLGLHGRVHQNLLEDMREIWENQSWNIQR